MISPLLSLEEFHFEPNDEAISSQKFQAQRATQHDILAERARFCRLRSLALYTPTPRSLGRHGPKLWYTLAEQRNNIATYQSTNTISDKSSALHGARITEI